MAPGQGRTPGGVPRRLRAALILTTRTVHVLRTARAPTIRTTGAGRTTRAVPRAPGCCRVGTYACATRGRRPSAASASICSASSAAGRTAGSLHSSAVMTGPNGPASMGSAASSLTTACMVVSGVVRRNGDLPSTAVYNVAPSDHRSEAGPGSCPRTRSGAM